MLGSCDRMAAVEGRAPAATTDKGAPEPPLPATSSFLALAAGDFAVVSGAGRRRSSGGGSGSSSGGGGKNDLSFGSYDLLAPEEELRNESSLMSDNGPLALPSEFDDAAALVGSPARPPREEPAQWQHAAVPSPPNTFLCPPKEALHNLRSYGAEHFQRMREAELLVYTPDPTYEHRQQELRPDMRAQLVDWMVEVSASFLVRRRTLQTAVNFCDRYLAACPHAFPRDRLQLLAVTALFVAAKMEEIYPPKAQEMAATTGGATAAKDILAFEQELMTTLNWNLAPPTVDDWAEGYLLALLDRLPPDTHTRIPKTLTRRLQLMLDLALLDVTALHFFPSTLAAAALGLLLPAELAPALAACTGYPAHEPALRHCQAYLTFVAAGLLEEEEDDVGVGDEEMGGLYDTPPATPSTAAAAAAATPVKEHQGGELHDEGAVVPVWDRAGLQRHTPQLLPHLLARITGLASTANSNTTTTSIAMVSPPTVSAAAATPMNVAATPLVVGCRAVGARYGYDEVHEAGMDEEQGTDYGGSSSDDDEEEEEGEEDHPFSPRYFRRAPKGIDGDSGRTNGGIGLLIDVAHRAEEHAAQLLASSSGGGGCEGDDGLVEGHDHEDELQWSAATTTDAACSRDSLFAFFDLDNNEERGKEEEDEGGYGGDAEGVGGGREGRRRRRPQGQSSHKRFASPEGVGVAFASNSKLVENGAGRFFGGCVEKGDGEGGMAFAFAPRDVATRGW